MGYKLSKESFLKVVKAEATSLLSLTRISVERALSELDEDQLRVEEEDEGFTHGDAVNVAKFVYLNLLEQVMEEILSTVEQNNSLEQDLENFRSTYF